MMPQCSPQYLLLETPHHGRSQFPFKKYIVIFHNWGAQRPKSPTFCLIYDASATLSDIPFQIKFIFLWVLILAHSFLTLWHNNSALKLSEECLTGIDMVHGACGEMGCKTIERHQTMWDKLLDVGFLIFVQVWTHSLDGFQWDGSQLNIA